MFGTPTPTDPYAAHYPPDKDGYEETLYAAFINADTPPDGIYIDLFNKLEPFPNSIMPTTVQLTADQADYSTCGACVEVDTDIDDDGNATHVYLADGGTLNLTSTSGTITGTISNATFRHVDIDSESYETTPNADGCQTTIERLTFTQMVEEQTDTGSGSAARFAERGARKASHLSRVKFH